jgi:hypothetical protein
MFNHLALPNGAATAIAASPVAAEVDRGTHMTMDSEGRIHAQNPGTARFLLDFGVTGGISKVSDDTTQLIIEAISSTATDASTAGVARFAAMGATGDLSPHPPRSRRDFASLHGDGRQLEPRRLTGK